MLKNFVRVLGGDPNKRTVDRLSQIVDQINSLEPDYEKLSDEALAAKTVEFRSEIADQLQDVKEEKARQKAEQDALDDILPEAFAVVREASKRTLGLRHYDVQLLGGMTLHQGKIAEMRTGEGKTLVATLTIYLNALLGRGIHLITVNDYLARRDARWNAPIYSLLGLSVGVLQMAARTENGKKAFLVDLTKESPHEDQNQLVLVPRRDAYSADITYGTNSEFGFDYLRDNMTYSLDDRVQRGHYYAIVDEVDNVLIDEARTPLIISGPASENVEEYYRMAQVVRQLRTDDYEISERDRNITLTEIGELHVEELLGVPLRDPDRPEDVTPEQARLLGYLEQALRAQFLFRRNKEYLVQGGKVIIVDEFTGRLMPGRRWSDGLHQAVEAKEGVKVEAESVTYATITLQNYFRMYQKLAGMSGTALTEAEEFSKIYKLDVLPIPANLEYNALRPASPLVELETRDNEGYKYRYYARKDDTAKTALFFRRKDYPDVIFRTEEAKFRAIVTEILRNHTLGRPSLIGTTSVELSERISARLRAEPLRRLAQVKILRDAWFKKNNQEEDGRTFGELKFMNEPLEKLDPGELRKMARDLEISANPEEPANLERLLTILGLSSSHNDRLASSLQGGVPHEVLNARKHDEESQIIAGAGAYGAATIATNMAGRGVDIKLGGELAEEHLAIINRVLKRAGYNDPYDLTLEQRRRALKELNPADWGIYEAEVLFFLKQMDDMEMVTTLGGLHVIGSERHEARRIDNQLRGRSARQGDPGSSRFYLSLEDELMRRFGGDQARNLMERFQIDDAVPLEYGIVSRIVESAQTRVEGANFDVRKHLLEYDDVLNTQRAAIYEQRDRVFTKDDLHEDIIEMLHAELKRRVSEALKDGEGPWKLIAWLEQVQPTMPVGKVLMPSFATKILVDHILHDHPIDRENLASQITEIVAEATQAEDDHLLAALRESIRQAESRLNEQRRDRREAMDTFLEGLSLGDEDQPRSARELSEELAGMLRLSLRFTPEQQRALRENPRQFAKELKPTIEAAILEQNITRLLGALDRRLPDNLELDPAALSAQGWDAAMDQLTAAVEKILDKRRQRLIGSDGLVQRELDDRLARLSSEQPISATTITYLLLSTTESTRASFDKKTHRRVEQRSIRYSPVYLAAHRIENQPEEGLLQDILSHLEETLQAIHMMWGQSELTRLSTARPVDLDERTQRRLAESLGADIYQRVKDQPLGGLDAEDRQTLIGQLGSFALTEIYRQLLLGVITEMWVDYLTQMEALRVSIMLESYAQRDPLVQYKAKASGLYQDLIRNTRLGVISRMFHYRPRDMNLAQASAGSETSPESEEGEVVLDENASMERKPDQEGKRKRHRKR